MDRIRINVSFEDEQLVKYFETGRNLHFGICLEINGGEDFYPDSIWRDFGVELLGIWTATILDMNGQRELPFIEGLPSIEITRLETQPVIIELRPRTRHDTVWQTTEYEFKAALIAALNEVQLELLNLDIGSNDIKRMEYWIELLS